MTMRAILLARIEARLSDASSVAADCARLQ